MGRILHKPSSSVNTFQYGSVKKLVWQWAKCQEGARRSASPRSSTSFLLLGRPGMAVGVCGYTDQKSCWIVNFAVRDVMMDVGRSQLFPNVVVCPRIVSGFIRL